MEVRGQDKTKRLREKWAEDRRRQVKNLPNITAFPYKKKFEIFT